ncbi:MAG: glycine betaine/proline transport system permease protein [Nocardioidaceae bacterium]|jgi:glycine betaine/proline transport system permease protein|nr:glycine betaine/proline transport system permease protein [Nocardioidaceae bacterium]
MSVSTTASNKTTAIPTSVGWRRAPRWVWLLALVAVWVVVWSFTRGHYTEPLGTSITTSTHDWITRHANAIQNSHSVFVQACTKVGDFTNSVITWLQELLSIPAFPRPVPQIGWLGVIALAGWAALATAGWRIAAFVVVCFFAFGALNYWQDSIDTLIMTFAAVLVCLVVGLPLGVWMGNSRTATAIVTPVLDVMQTFPSFVYLLPVVLFFGIGTQAALIATLIYALPPVVRISAHGIRDVPTSAIEATNSLGQTRLQRLMKVQVPMAKRTIIVGVNQTMMAALSMVTIAAFVNGPGLGKPVIEALQALQVGQGFVAGLAIVIMAIMLDRTTTAISERSERLARAGGGNKRLRIAVLAVTGVLALVAVYISRTYLWAANFPTGVDLGTPLQTRVDSVSTWITNNLDTETNQIKNQISYILLNPLQDLIANSPWWLVAAVILTAAALLGGVWAVVSSLVCLAGIYYLDLWQDSMVTLTSVLVGTILVMVLAVVFGVWMGRSRLADRLLRPILDAGQTMPPFVYLVPALALFQPTRFTAIVAGVVYAAPAAIKLVADGIRGVSPTAIEAAQSSGSTRWQIITRVQLPMARSSLVLAANQGLLYVLAMVVVGGLVGAGALGYDIVQGFDKPDPYFGKGIAAGISIVLLGIMLDRITRRAAMRSGGSAAHQ